MQILICTSIHALGSEYPLVPVLQLYYVHVPHAIIKFSRIRWNALHFECHFNYNSQCRPRWTITQNMTVRFPDNSVLFLSSTMSSFVSFCVITKWRITHLRIKNTFLNQRTIEFNILCIQLCDECVSLSSWEYTIRLCEYLVPLSWLRSIIYHYYYREHWPFECQWVQAVDWKKQAFNSSTSLSKFTLSLLSVSYRQIEITTLHLCSGAALLRRNPFR